MKKVIDLFCGAGGLSAGLRSVGFTIKAGVDIDSQALQTYQYNFRRAATLQADIANVTPDDLRRAANLAREDHEFLLAGCPPCQGFSNIGKRNANDEKNQLVFQYIRLIEELQPNFILMENVPGMAKNVGRLIFHELIERLTPLYHIDTDTLNAADYGVPQMRNRLVLHGVRRPVYDVLRRIVEKDEINFLPRPTHAQNPEGHLCPWISVGEAILDLPPLRAGEAFHGKISNHVARHLSETNLRRLAAIRANGGNRQGIAEQYQLDCHRRKRVSYTDTYGILNPDRPSPTMTSGCTLISKGRFGHPLQNRGLSVREAARLQSFDDDFVFLGSLASMSLQIGNAVPPRLAAASGKQIYKYMALYERHLRG